MKNWTTYLDTGKPLLRRLIPPRHEEFVVGEIFDAGKGEGRGDVLLVAPAHVVNAHQIRGERHSSVQMYYRICWI